MTNTRIKELVEAWKARLGLGDWRVDVKFVDEAGDVEAIAQVQPSKHFDDATLIFYRDELAKLKSDYEVEVTIVHELLHLAHRDVEAITDLLDGQVHRDVETVLVESFRHSTEQFVDRMARVLIRLHGNV